MGFFKKIFRGVKKVFKKIGRGIKSVFKGIGKFMNKIGIVGQIALMFLPLGPLLSGLLKGIGGMAANVLTTYGGAIGQSIVNGAKFVITKGAEFAGAVKNTFKTVTDGVSTFVSEFTKTGLNKMGFDPTKFGFKPGGSFNQWVQSGKGQSFGDAWGKVTTNITDNIGKILDPLKGSLEATSKTTLEGLSDSTYRPIEDIKTMNPQIRDWDNLNIGQKINLDMDNIVDMRSYGMRDITVDASIDYGMLPESITGRAVTPAKAGSLLQRGVPVPTQESLTAFQKGMKSVESLGLGTPVPTEKHWVDFNKPAIDTSVTGGDGLLSMPSVGDAAGQVGLEVAKTAAVDAYRGEPEYTESTGGIPMDFGNAPIVQFAQPANFIDTSMQQFASLRTPNAPFGYTPFNYANYMRT